jgi:hypothetical protein
MALETMVHGWTVHDLVSPLAAHCVVADARQIRQIANASVKTDGQNALTLASLLSGICLRRCGCRRSMCEMSEP